MSKSKRVSRWALAEGRKQKKVQTLSQLNYDMECARIKVRRSVMTDKFLKPMMQKLMDEGIVPPAEFEVTFPE